jgi:DNA-binding MarR family transcriptional regulator
MSVNKYCTGELVMDQLFELFLKHGLRPLSLFSEVSELERVVSRSELAALIILQFHDEMAMSELATYLGVPLSTMTSLGKRLVHKGLIERSQSGKDQRIILIRLTEKGQLLAQQAKGIIDNILVRVQEVLSNDELQQFLSLTMKVVKALQQKEEKGTETETETENHQFRKIQIED